MAEKNDSPGSTSTSTGHESQPLLSSFITEIVKSPINLILVGVIALLVYKIVKSKTKIEEPVKEIKKLPQLRRDFTLEELKKYNGKGPDGRILIAINGSIYDCTCGAHFYGPGAPYEVFGGKDISRALAKFSLETSQEYDDLSDLKTGEMESIREWEEQFKEKYDYVGRLLKPGEAPTNYSDEEDEGSQLENETKSKND
ncbi:membrane-associated progesterone receptor component 1 [Apis laboriosa]|uniref:Membrane-associated progesterone receptor component n=2 Tax=Apis cerana TaxID=7461 RepID=A0A2A3ERC2_APICC|nr:membrane-associated progesterone receptor component 1 [Apis dorsata]XP_016906244.1 membrane-associated progesterone receptor component 1 [Apis cerana]XP_043798089.1 membrane-associated progesterone receptor component 1 [Apis laboriosa]PBC34240.1 Membrane-associated progesterone receptor component [Apis cerana cerana]